jgi:hypothetical protein
LQKSPKPFCSVAGFAKNGQHMEENNCQQIFFQQIKNSLPPHKSLVDEVASILDLSNDSAYRRIRGEKPLLFDEMQKLANHFKVSIDQILHLQTDSFIFQGRITNNTDFDYEKWLHSCVDVLQMVKSFNPHHMWYLAKEIPFFYYFLIPEIAAFKSFFFMRSVLDYEDWKSAKFSVNHDYSRFHEVWRKISSSFATVPGTEIWSIENITSTLHQIEFYRVTGVLESDEDAICLFDKIIELINHLEMQAECGYKLFYKQKPTGNSGGSYRMFINELTMGDNMQLVQLGNGYVTYINHSVINYIVTKDPAFNTYTKKIMEVTAQKSTPISEVNEKERLMFFNRLRAKVKYAKQQISVTLQP